MITARFLKGIIKPKPNGVSSPDVFRQLIEKERCRANRNDHRYSLLILQLTPEAVNGNGLKLKKAIGVIQERIRNVDEVGWYAERQLGIILPYTSQDGARKLAEDLCTRLEPWVGGAAWEVYSYPAAN